MLELWGGVECTVNRVGDQYLDQLKMSGHDGRADDLGRFAGIGIRTLRFPIIWERFAPDCQADIDWSWADDRLSRARALGIRVIVGFVHHGSGPQSTDLLDNDFGKKLGRFAAAFAERFPWVDAYTPINEPLTTARFSGLYGCWYPHATDNKNFLRMLWNECEGIKEAMTAVRSVNPKAELVQTEDLGKIFSTEFLAYQAEFENHRRWLSFDILAGRLNPEHALYEFCRKHGLSSKEMQRFADTPCRPDIIGINHYITSNRFLDERLERYPRHMHGGNERHRYADIEAVRVGAENHVGPEQLMQEAWERYGIPLALTEVHLGCSREEQMRWFDELWRAAKKVEAEGVPVRAVTAWSLLGGFEWNSLVTKNDGYYESGAFDLRAPSPRPTALVPMIKAFSEGETYDHPVLDNPGWWHRPVRLLYPAVSLDQKMLLTRTVSSAARHKRTLLVTGGPGTLGKAFACICEKRGLDYKLISRRDLDLAEAQGVRTYLNHLRPWAIINAAGYCRVDDAETDAVNCHRDNVMAPLHLAEVCADSDIRLVSFSTDFVFDGQSSEPYRESAGVAPLNAYGRSKAKAETELLSRYNQGLVIRTSSFFGPWDEHNFLTLALRSIGKGEEFFAADDLIISPTYVPDLVETTLDLLIDGERGIWHLTNQGAMHWAGFGRLAAKISGLDPSLIVRRSASEFGWKAQRPSFSALTSEKALLMPDLERSIHSYLRECRVTLL